MTQASFNGTKTIFINKLELNLRNKLVKFSVSSKSCYGAKTWTLRKVDKSRLESFEMWCWKRTETFVGLNER